MSQQYFYDKQIRRYIQQFIRLFSGFSVQMGKNKESGLPVFHKVPVRYGDINRMAAHITRENSENIMNTVPFISCYVTNLNLIPERRTYQDHVDKVQVYEKKYDQTTGEYKNEKGKRKKLYCRASCSCSVLNANERRRVDIKYRSKITVTRTNACFI